MSWFIPLAVVLILMLVAAWLFDRSRRRHDNPGVVDLHSPEREQREAEWRNRNHPTGGMGDWNVGGRL